MGNQTKPIPMLEARVRLHHETSPNGKQRLLGFADLTIGEAFVIKSIRIVQPFDPDRKIAGELVVLFPGEKFRAGAAPKWYDVAHPITREARAAAVRVILEAFARAAGGQP